MQHAGADVGNMQLLRRDFPEAALVRLEENYRSTEAILTLANRLIAFNKVRHDKVLRAARPGGEQPRIEQYKDEEAEAQAVAHDIKHRLRQPGVEPRDFAVLFRTNEQPRVFETELRKADIPYVLIGGRSFFDRKEVRDLLAYLRVLDSPEDETSLKRIINCPPRGVGPKAVEALTSVVRAQMTKKAATPSRIERVEGSCIWTSEYHGPPDPSHQEESRPHRAESRPHHSRCRPGLGARG